MVVEVTDVDASISTESSWTDDGGKKTPPIDDVSRTEMELMHNQQGSPQSILH